MENNKLLVIIAVVAGVFATGLAFTYIQTATGSSVTKELKQETVLIVKTDLPANHILDPDRDFIPQKVPSEQFGSFVRLCFKADEQESLRGERLGSPVPGGTPLQYAHMKLIQDTNLAPGTRALGVRVKSENMMGGLLVPSDRVDIIATYRLPKEATSAGASGGGAINPNDPASALGSIFSQLADKGAYPDEFKSQEVLSNVRIVGVGSSLGSSRQQFMFTGENQRSGGGDRVITIEVTPEQAIALIQADSASNNNLTLLLRPNSRMPTGANVGTVSTDGG